MTEGENTVAEDVEVTAGTVQHSPAENAGILGGAEERGEEAVERIVEAEAGEDGDFPRARRSASATNERDLSMTLSAKGERAEGLSNLELHVDREDALEDREESRKPPRRNPLVWFQLPNLPIHLFDFESISRICALIGREIALDSATSGKSRPMDSGNQLFEKGCLRIVDVVVGLDTGRKVAG
nr:TMV resistance protein N-like [Ipomoea batatas]